MKKVLLLNTETKIQKLILRKQITMDQSSKKTWKCEKCDSAFDTKSGLKSHSQRSLCNPNAHSGLSFSDLRKHKVGKFYVCPHCSKIYQSDKALRGHILSETCRKPKCTEPHQHNLLSKQFKDYEDALNFIKIQEYDALFYRRSVHGKNIYFECNRGKKGLQNYTPKNRSKKLKDGCPAKFSLSQTKAISSQVLTNPHLKDIYETSFLLSGCLTHSHNTDNLDFVRLPVRVRKNIVQLLKLGVSIGQMKEKYLKTDYFGGMSGKVPRHGIFCNLQRRHLPLKPELNSASESEMVLRYMHSKSIRAFCFKCKSNPKFKTPKFMEIKAENECFEEEKHKQGSTVNSMAKVLKADDFVAIMMDQYQREKLRIYPKTLVVYCTQNVYHSPEFYLVSLLVIDKTGIAVPVLKVLSATDVHQTATAVMETLKSLEPEACSQLSLLMSDEQCYSPFIEAIANVLKPEVLTTLPLQVSLVDKYDKILQSSLGKTADRLDTLIFALFEMDETIQREQFRAQYGLKKLQSSEQVTFEESHTQLASEIKIEQLEVEEEGSKVWAVKSSDDSEVYIVTQNSKRVICNQERCEVKCKLCSESNVQFCLHQLTCSCQVFIESNACLHLHILNMFHCQSDQDQADVKPKLMPVKSPVGVSVLGRNTPKLNLLKQTLSAEISEFCWCVLISEDVSNILEIIAKEMTVEDREEILGKMIIARSIWACKKCDSYSIDSILGGYLECTFCTHWFHAKCVDPTESVQGGLFVCESCVALKDQSAEAVLSKDTLVILPNANGDPETVKIVNVEMIAST